MLKNRLRSVLNLSTLLALCISLIGSALSVTPARAASIVVNSNGDTVANDGFCSLREAITSANSDTASGALAGECATGSGTDTISVPAGTYTLTLGSQLPAVTTTMTITGNGEANTIIEASTCNPVTLPAGCTPATYRVFEVTVAGSLTLNDLTVQNGVCDGSCSTETSRGGGLYNEGALTLAMVTFRNNKADLMGGGVNNQNGSLTFNDVTFDDNHSMYGGGLNNWSTSSPGNTPSLTDVTFSNNTAASYGGGMDNMGGRPTLLNVTFSGNQSYYGGGMLSFNSGNATLNNVTFSNNTATDTGTTAGYGGGMAIMLRSEVTLNNATFSGNTAGTAGGGIYIGADSVGDNSKVTLKNVIIANSTSGGDCVTNLTQNATVDAQNSLIADGLDCVNGTTNDNNLTGDPNLDILKNNGGSTQTHALLSPSPAIDAGTTCTPTDQRGVARPQDGDGNSSATCDIGAYEYIALPTITSLSPSTGPATGGSSVVITGTNLTGGTVTFGGTAATCTVDSAVQITCTTPAHTAGALDVVVTTLNGTVTSTGGFTAIGGCFVKSNASGSNNGGSWTDAYTSLQSALGNVGCNEIWVAAGTYTPGVARTDSFLLKSGVAIYGGFAGTETLRTQRNYTANITTLSGDIGTLVDNTDNSYHVVTGSGTNNTAVLDGFVITAGNANGTIPNYEGGGIYNLTGSPTLANITFSNNAATWSGGGMYNENSSPALTNVTFSNNSATWGGGMANEISASPALTNVTFSSNTATNEGGGMYNKNSNPVIVNSNFTSNTVTGTLAYGGGIYNEGSSPTLTNISFQNNTATGPTAYGGGMINWSASHPVLTNVTFSGNQATGTTAYGGGMLNDVASNPILTNVTFSNNSATLGGGGLTNNAGSSPVLKNVTFYNNHATAGPGGGMINGYSNPAPSIRNTIFWGNTGTSGTVSQQQIYTISGTPVISDSVIEGGYAGGTNIITTDPLLGTLGSYGGSTQTVPLLPGSSAIDAGNATYCTTGSDQRGVSYVGVKCDIGAFESQGFVLGSLTGTPQNVTIGGSFASALGLTVTANNNAEPVNGGVVTFTPPASGASATLTGSPAPISGGTVSVSASANGSAGGPYNVVASTSGASSENFALTNDKATPVITFGTAPTPSYLGGNFTVSASTTNTDSATLTYSYVSGPCAFVSGAQFSTSGAGTCVVQANGAATSNFNAALPQTQNVLISMINQATLTAVATPSTVPYGSTSALTTTGGNGTGAVTYSAGTSTGCSITGSTLTVTDASGTCSVSATRAADINYNATTSAEIAVTLVKADQSITFDSTVPASAVVDGATYTPMATSTSGLAVTITIDATATSVCSISGGAVSFQIVGTCTINANQAGNTNYNAAPQVQQSFVVHINQTLTVSKSGTGSGTVTSSPAGINCGVTCSYAFANNTVVTLTAAPTSPSTFGGWSGGGCSGIGTCTVTMSAAQSVTATFTAPINGSGDTTGVFRPSNALFYLKNQNTSGFADVAINYGTGGDYPVAGDWDGNGTITIGIYRNGSFYLRNSNTLGYADLVFAFGASGDQPVAGDWDGDGIDTIGVYSNGQFLLRNTNTAGPADMSFYLGNPGDIGIAGDWNGDGSDTTGVFRPSNGVIFLKNLNTSGFADININYGLSGDMPVTGDWDNDGIDTIGVYRNAQFLLRNSNTVGFADMAFYLGIPGDMPIAGNWDGIP